MGSIETLGPGNETSKPIDTFMHNHNVRNCTDACMETVLAYSSESEEIVSQFILDSPE